MLIKYIFTMTKKLKSPIWFTKCNKYYYISNFILKKCILNINNIQHEKPK